VLVHNQWLADQIRDAHPNAAIDVVEMGVRDPASRPGARQHIRAQHRISDDAVVFTSFGKVTPEKRVREAMRALAAVAETVPRARLLIAGETVDYYDLEAEAAALGIVDNVTFAGYVADEDVDDYLAASDVCLCMRWPTSRETSASWLRCLAAGRATISTDLVHTVDIPTLDPRSWSLMGGEVSSHRPVGIGIDILDEDHSLKLALRRLATDDKLRSTLGLNARQLWAERFRLHQMAAGYERVIAHALRSPIDSRKRDSLPAHLRSDGAEHAEALIREITGEEYYLGDGH
jgi:glycosyltransferase involved in cell wall biosynthesis